MCTHTHITGQGMEAHSYNPSTQKKTEAERLYQGWRDGSGVKSRDCSSRGLGFNSQYPQQLTTVCNSSSRESDSLAQTDMQEKHQST